MVDPDYEIEASPAVLELLDTFPRDHPLRSLVVEVCRENVVLTGQLSRTQADLRGERMGVDMLREEFGLDPPRGPFWVRWFARVLDP